MGDSPAEQPTREQREAQLEQMRSQNQTAFESIVRQGVRIDPGNVILMRVNTLIEALLTEDDRLNFELMFEAEMTGLLDEAQSQINKAKLTSPLLGPNGQGLPPSSPFKRG